MPELRDQLRSALGGTYSIERELHGGGMSRVFLAEETQFERKVVIKVLSPELAAGISAERFEREIKLAAQLQQANIVAVHAAGEVGGLPYYTMPFVEGESLRARLGRGQQLTVSESVAILKDVARALAYAHSKGVVHRDIKPENILLSGDAAVVTDFGIAKAVSESKTNAPGGTLTVVGTSLGTPAYMAPEQAVGDVVDQRADIYAWGLIAYEILTGAHAFPGKTSAQQWITAQLAEKPAQIGQRRSGLPKGLAALVMKCLEKEPANRPQTASDILHGLEDQALMKSAPIASRGMAANVGNRVTRSPRSFIIAGIAAVVVIAVLVGRGRIVAVMRSPASPQVSADNTVASATGNSINTVAVLPFTNTGGGSQDEYFSDGMTDELAHALSRLPALRVASRTSSYAFKGKSASPQEIGKTLNVRGIIEGTVRRAGDRLRVTAQLSSASDGLVVWSDNYESKAKDVFALQDEFTKAIVTAIAPTLRGGTASSVASAGRGTENLEAYDLYLKGRFFWAKRGSINLMRAIAYFNQAIARDPKFARAYAGRAMAEVVLPAYSSEVGDTMVDRAIASSNRALALDSSLAEPHLALGSASTSRLKFAESETHFQAGLRLDQSNAIGHLWHGQNLEGAGDIKGALSEIQEAERLDPLSAVIGGNLVATLMFARRIDEAISLATRVLEIDSTQYTFTYSSRGTAHIFAGQTDTGLADMQTNYRLAPQTPGARGTLVFSYAAAGRWKEAADLRHEIIRRNAGNPADPDIFFSDIAFGDRAGTLTTLEQAFEPGSAPGNLTQSPGCDPMLDILKSEPRYVSLMRSKGIKICPATARWPIGKPPA
ncbi:MAG: protein kinase [Gemmatimonadales bacterium]